MLHALATLAHAGHDHRFSLGGEQHHWLWIGAAVFAATFVVCLAARRWMNR